jgi:hypothetical protein
MKTRQGRPFSNKNVAMKRSTPDWSGMWMWTWIGSQREMVVIRGTNRSPSLRSRGARSLIRTGQRLSDMGRELEQDPYTKKKGC